MCTETHSYSLAHLHTIKHIHTRMHSCSYQQANEVVIKNYAVVSLYHAEFEQTVTKKTAAVDIPTLGGTVGGTMGLTTGASLMGFMEWAELGYFALISIPFFLFGVKQSHLKR